MIADKKQRGAKNPTHRISQRNGNETESQRFGNCQIDLTENNEGTEHDHCRGGRVAYTPQSTGIDLVETDCKIEGGYNPDKADSEVDHLRIRGKEPQQLPGALLAFAACAAITFGFRIYVDNFCNFDALYGSIATVALFLFWLFVVSYVLIACAFLNHVLTEHARRRA